MVLANTGQSRGDTIMTPPEGSVASENSHQASMSMPCDTCPGVPEAEESNSQLPASHAEASTSTPRDLDGPHQPLSLTESLSEEFDIIEKATRLSASGGTCDAGESERRK
ncbi:expressed unknown protein [Seminavis robusta]|uniref:Uncharacterized protein n=1 Tax=Seminavis robusta TaxID=568900 RepID=A0A9N8EPA4_9STRA|nr:expressed unknown protein [Seminavis robusta]|eukprot:Sro1480_g276150.1 n/a (110) ;mRNA; f:9995-10324